MKILKIIQTSSPLEREKFKLSLKKLNNFGIEFEVPEKKKPFFFTFNLKDKIKELKKTLSDKKIKFILAERGGAGAIHLLPFLKNLKIKDKKVLIGSSDITYLGLFLLEKHKFPFCHGPMLSDLGRDNFSEIEEEYFKLILEKKDFLYKNLKGLKYLKKGKTEGKLIGGNLTLFVSTLSFFKFSSFKGKILFLEDINEPLYKIDRNLHILKILGILDDIKGVIFGKMKDCFKESGKNSFIKLINEYFKDKRYPVVLFFPSGHSVPNFPLWIGGEILIDTNKKIIESRFKYD